MEPERRDVWKARLLRGLVIAMGVLGVVAAMFCFVPAVEVYTDSNACFGDALGRVFTFEHTSHGPCENSWVLEETRGPVEHPLEMALYFLLVIAPGALVWHRPKLRLALAWTLMTLVSTVVMIVATFDLFGDWGKQLVQLWPAYVFGVAASVLVTTLILVVPLFCGIFAFLTRTRRPPRPEFPKARVVER